MTENYILKFKPSELAFLYNYLIKVDSIILNHLDTLSKNDLEFISKSRDLRLSLLNKILEFNDDIPF